MAFSAPASFFLNSDMPCTIVIKLGTSSIIDETTQEIRDSIVNNVVSTVSNLRNEGFRVVIVSSGAVGLGLRKMDMLTRPDSLSGKQALAAIGQGEIISMWSSAFAEKDLSVAQILLTHEDIASPKRYNNAVKTFHELFSVGAVPIVNENDTLSTKEIQIGDNDTLGAITAAMVQASYLFLLTDVDSLYATNPKHDINAPRIDTVTSMSSLKDRIDSSDLGAGSMNGTGGMRTKLRAAEIASAAGIFTVITSSSKPNVVHDILEYYNNKRMRFPTDTAVTISTPASTRDDARPCHTLFCPEPLHDVDLSHPPSFLDLPLKTAPVSASA